VGRPLIWMSLLKKIDAQNKVLTKGFFNFPAEIPNWHEKFN